MKTNQTYSVEEYLQLEREAHEKHEYVAGSIYAMSGGRNVHQLISTNVTVALATQLRGNSCRAYNSDTKIRIRMPGQTRF